jgi:transaldolase
VKDLSVKIFADGADRAGMLEMARLPYIAGFTTNPTLMRKAGVTDYERFAREIPEKALADRQRPSQVFSRNRPDVSRRCG